MRVTSGKRFEIDEHHALKAVAAGWADAAS